MGPEVPAKYGIFLPTWIFFYFRRQCLLNIGMPQNNIIVGSMHVLDHFHLYLT